jgi:hypothetical protein
MPTNTQHDQNIARFLKLQSEDDGGMIMLSHQHTLQAAEETDRNISRFLELQGQDDGGMIMLSHQMSLE